NFPVVAFKYHDLYYEKCLKSFDYISKDTDISIIYSIIKFSDVLSIIFSLNANNNKMNTIKNESMCIEESLYNFYINLFTNKSCYIDKTIFIELRAFIYKALKFMTLNMEKKQSLEKLICSKFNLMNVEKLIKISSSIDEIKSIKNWR